MTMFARCILKCRCNIRILKERIVLQDLLTRRARGEQFEDILDAQAITANAWPPATDGGIDGDAGGDFGHGRDPVTEREVK